MIPPRSPASAPVDLTPMVGGSQAAAVCRALGQPVRVVPIDEEDGQMLIVEPLHFHRLVANGRGLVKISPFHTQLNATKGRQDNV